MSKIRIKNFGPIKEGYLDDDGFLDIKKVTIFIGNQGSGKSTVAKVISLMTWLEKAVSRGDIKGFSIHNLNGLSFDGFKTNLKYQGISTYFLYNSEIEYCNEKYSFSISESLLEDLTPRISKSVNTRYISPKIMYIPAERNTLSSITNIKGMPDHLLTFYEELRRANKELKGKRLKLPINDYEYEYDEQADSTFIIGSDYKINILNASSGIQSFAPLYVVTRNLAQLVTESDEIIRKSMNSDSILKMNEEMAALEVDDSISESDKIKQRQEIKAKFLPKCFINIVEEPEQNLYPTSQRQILNSLLEFNNQSEGNKLIMTTHSPYILSYLTLAIKGQQVFEKIKLTPDSESLVEQLNNIVPVKSLIHPDDLAIYQLDDDGNITKLDNYKGLPSDENYLNDGLELTNVLFSQLLDLEDLCQ